MAVVFKFRSLWRSLFHGSQVRILAPAEPVEIVYHGTQAELTPQQAARRLKRWNQRANRRMRKYQAELQNQMRANRERYADPDEIVDLSAGRLVSQAREMFAMGFVPSAAATARMAMEKHLQGICEAHDIRAFRTTKPTIGDYVKELRRHCVLSDAMLLEMDTHLCPAHRGSHAKAVSWWEVASLLAFAEVLIAATPTDRRRKLAYSEGGAA